MEWKHISYNTLNGKQKERYNFQKIASLLADYGFSSIKLDDDWQGADFIARHNDGNTFLKIQLKARLTLDKKYIGKEVYIAFPHNGDWYVFNHDELLDKFLISFANNMAISKSWTEKGGYSWFKLSKEHLKILQPYLLKPVPKTVTEQIAKSTVG